MQNNFEFGSKRKSFSDGVSGNSLSSEKLQQLCDSVLRDSAAAFRDAAIEAAFYPYLGLTHTLRRKQDKWIVRISDHCRSAPAPVIEAIVRILACRLMHRKPPRTAVEIYDLFRRNPEIEDAVRRRRAAKGRKQFSGKHGTFHSLENIYRELNDRYFNKQIEVKRIGWGLRKGRDRLGHYDPVHNTITLSPLLDSPDVPPFVVRYIVYHEMLHALFGDGRAEGSRKHHPREFRHTESAYPDYARAKKFLAGFSRRHGRRS